MIKENPLSTKHRQLLTRTSLSVVKAMVKNGYTFFSSVKTDTNDHEYFMETEYAMEDSMFFHIPDTGVLIQLRLMADVVRKGHRREREMRSYLKASLMIETKPLMADVRTYRELMALAQEKGFVSLRWLSDYDRDKSECFDIPFIHQAESFPHWRAGCGSTDHRADSTLFVDKNYETERDTSHQYEHMIDSLCAEVFAILPFVAHRPNHQFQEVMSSSFWPQTGFPSSEKDFWEKFNSRYFRKLVKHVI